jgi:hypothetical protein
MQFVSSIRIMQHLRLFNARQSQRLVRDLDKRTRRPL